MIIVIEAAHLGEAVGDTAVFVEAGDVQALTAALDRVVLEMPEHERRRLELRGRDHALAFNRVRVFADLFRAQLQPLRRFATVTTLRLHDERAAGAG